MGSSISHETYESINEDFYDGKKYYAKFTEDYFAEGACRYAFMGTLYGKGPRNKSKCVTKVFKDEAASKLKNWVPEIAASKRAFRYAQHFQEKYFPRISGSAFEIEFLIPLLAQMKNISGINLLWFIEAFKDERYVKKRSMVAIEPFIEGSYEKFNSNGGYEKQGGLHSIVNTFSHWTWHVSRHKYMVCDQQGVKSGRKYILTDPAIHSAEFGATDFGALGMERVLGNHTCNNFCEQLGLGNPYTGIPVASGRRPTTYTFNLTDESRPEEGLSVSIFTSYIRIRDAYKLTIQKYELNRKKHFKDIVVYHYINNNLIDYQCKTKVALTCISSYHM